MDIGYIQVVDMTDEEKIEMYMKHTKREIAEMLLNCNKVLDKICEAQNIRKYEYGVDTGVSGEGYSSSSVTLSSHDLCECESDCTEPGIDCSHLCHDCDKGAYCWDSDCNENKNG